VGHVKVFIRKMSELDWLMFQSWLLWQIPTRLRSSIGSIIEVLKENPDLSFVAVADGKVIGYVQAEALALRLLLKILIGHIRVRVWESGYWKRSYKF